MFETIRYKIADTEREFLQIHQLNHQVFVKEIPQHEERPDGLLVDKFHDKNKYAIALKNDRLIGMTAFNDVRPFSLDFKVPDLDKYLPTTNGLVEFRLLAIEPEARGGVILFKLLDTAYHWFKLHHKHFEYALISGTSRQIKLYEKMGFVRFYKWVGTPEALYHPMYLNIESFLQTHANKLKSY